MLNRTKTNKIKLPNEGKNPYDVKINHQYEDIDHVYFNVAVNYNDNPDHAIRYQLLSNNNLIDRVGDYYLSISRFYCPISNIPLLSAFPIQPNQPDPNLSSLSVTLQYGTDIQQVFLIWKPDNTTIATPLGPSLQPGGIQAQTPYYFVYDYNTFLSCVNVALNTAFNNLSISPPVIAPYMQFNSHTDFFSLIAQIAYYDLAGSTPIKIFFNTPLSNFFIGLDFIQTGNYSANGEDYQINVVNRYNNWYNPSWAVPSVPPLFYEITQEYSSLDQFNDLIGISIESSTLPIRKEFNQTLNNGTMISRPILSDFNILYSSILPRSAIQYNANLYRLIDLNGETPLNNINLHVYYTTKTNQTYEIYLDENQTATFKLVFLRKSLYRKYIRELTE